MTAIQIWAILQLLLAFNVPQPTVDRVQVILNNANKTAQAIPAPVQLPAFGNTTTPQPVVVENKAPTSTTLKVQRIDPSGDLNREPRQAQSGMCGGSMWLYTTSAYLVSVLDQNGQVMSGQSVNYIGTAENDKSGTILTIANFPTRFNYEPKNITEGTVYVTFSIGNLSTTTSFTIIPFTDPKPAYC